MRSPILLALFASSLDGFNPTCIFGADVNEEVDPATSDPSTSTTVPTTESTPTSTSMISEDTSSTETSGVSETIGTTVGTTMDVTSDATTDIASFCGDGNIDLDEGEVCDKGDDNSSEMYSEMPMACSTMCKYIPYCGDGIANGDEQCDDGDDDDTDECLASCVFASCGDEIIQDGEECDDLDDSETPEGDKCYHCALARRVFVTQQQFFPEDILGVKNADQTCATIAKNTLPELGTSGNTWIAWLSDDESSPSTRMGSSNTNFKGWYLLPNDQRVAEGWDGLKSGMLENAIEVTNSGSKIMNVKRVWTNTRKDGTVMGGPDEDCDNWTISSDKQSTRGSAAATDEAWTNDVTDACNGAALRLYCFEMSKE